MNKLLRADFSRLKRDKVFWICMLFQAGFAIFVLLMANQTAEKMGSSSMGDNWLFYFVILSGILSAAITSLFIGTDYSDGTMRNKLIVGRGRSQIYLSHLIVSTVSGIFMSLTYMAFFGLGRLILQKPFETDPVQMVQVFTGSMLVVMAFSALFTLLAMVGQNKASVAVVSLIVSFTLLFGSIYMGSKLTEPEMWDEYIYLDDDGNVVKEPASKNLNYVDGMKRTIFEFLQDFQPSGQALQYVGMDTSRFGIFALYAVLITVGSTTAGIIVFRKKDLK